MAWSSHPSAASPRRHGRVIFVVLLLLVALGFASPFAGRSFGSERILASLETASLSGLNGIPDEIVPLIRNEQETTPLHKDQIVTASPVAFLAANPGLSAFTAVDCLTAAVYYEAGYEPREGQRAVAQVVLNRVKHPSFPSSVCGVVFEGSQRASGCQFTFTCDGSLSRVPAASSWERARAVAIAALSGYVEPSVGHATHYHATYVQPYWASGLLKLNVIGSHAFYLWPGSAGLPRAFSNRYDANEEIPSNARLRLSRHLLSATADMTQTAAFTAVPSDHSPLSPSDGTAQGPRQASNELASAGRRPESGTGLIEQKAQLIQSQATLKPSLSSAPAVSTKTAGID